MKFYSLLITAFFAISFPAQAYVAGEEVIADYVAPDKDSIIDYCAKRYPTDFVMERDCRGEQVVAWLEYRKMFDELRNTRDRTSIAALTICRIKWRPTSEGKEANSSEKSEFINWVMLTHCWKEQLKAARAMGK